MVASWTSKDAPLPASTSASHGIVSPEKLSGKTGQQRSLIASHLNLDVRNSPATLVCDDCPPRSTPMQDGDGGHFDETGNRQEVGQRFRALVTTPSVCNKIARSADPRLTLYCRGKVSCPARRGSCRGNEPPDRARCDPSPDRGQRADAAQSGRFAHSAVPRCREDPEAPARAATRAHSQRAQRPFLPSKKAHLCTLA